MPAAATGHKTYIPKDEGKAREGMTVDRRGGHAKGQGIGKGRLSSNKQQLRSPTPIPRRGQRPQEKFPNIDESVQEAFEFVKQNSTTEQMGEWLTDIREFFESVHGGSQRWTCRKQSPQAARVPLPADARRRIRADPPDKEYTRSPRASRGQGSRAARGDERASAPRAGSGPKTHASRGHGRPRRDGELQAPQPAGITKSAIPLSSPHLLGR